MDKKVLSDSKKAGIDDLIEKPFTSETITKIFVMNIFRENS